MRAFKLRTLESLYLFHSMVYMSVPEIPGRLIENFRFSIIAAVRYGIETGQQLILDS